MMMDFRDNLQKCQEYVKALEEERRKIQVFQRELPLCLELVTQAIEACKQQLSGTTTVDCLNGHSECSEQTTSNGPVLEEFIPIKRSNSDHDDNDDDDHDDDVDEHESEREKINNAQSSDDNNNNSDKLGKKSDWLRSAQLWNQNPDPPGSATHEEHDLPKRVAVVEVKKSKGGAFHPFQKEKTSTRTTGNDNQSGDPAPGPAASACSSHDDGGRGGSNGGGSSSGSGKKEEKSGQTQRKARRCWSPELHRRFLHALQQLGGSHAATPKQIRELMKVDGLTNDEVKSHLQKYRLHTRRPTPSIHNNANPQAPQFVVVGGIWMPAPPEYAAAAAARSATGETATLGPSSGIYAPVAAMAAPPPPVHVAVKKQKSSIQSHCQERESRSRSHCEGDRNSGARRSSSPATSSSTHTTTASHNHPMHTG